MIVSRPRRSRLEEASRTFPRARMFGSLFLVAVAVRAIGYPTVFSNAGVQLPYAGDAYYHLRRIWYSVARFPETLSFDRYVSFPDGSQIIWPAAFDWTIAALIRPFVDPLDQSAVEAMAAWMPVVLGAATAGLLALLADRFYGRAAGWCAGLLYCVLPMSFIYSRLGMIDHHVAVALLTTLMLWLACETFSRDDRAETWMAAISVPGARLGGVVGLAMAATILTWPGALLHVGFLQLAFCLRWLMAEDLETARVRGVSFSITQIVLAVSIAPFTVGTVWREFGDWSPLVLSNFQPLYFGCAGAMVCLVQILHERYAIGDSRGRRIASAIAIALAGLLGALIVFHPLRDAIAFAGGWFTHAEESLNLVFEMQPILATAGYFDPSFAIDRFGMGFFVMPLAWLYLAWRAFAARNAPQGLFLFWSLAFMGLTLRQWRFGNTLAVVYAVMIGAVLAEWISQLRRRIAERPLRPAAEILVVLVLFVWSAVALIGFYRPIVQMSLRAVESERQRNLGPLPPGRRIYDEAGRWLLQHTARTSGYLDSELAPEYAVLANLSLGHLLRYRSERPMIQDNFGLYAGRRSFESAWAYYAERDEAAAIEILEGLGVRYVIGGAGGAGSLTGLEADAMAFRLWRRFGSDAKLRGGGSLPGLSQHRLIFHAHTAPPHRKSRSLGDLRRFESLGVWEIVPGAQIEGNAEPGAAIRLSLDVATTSNTRLLYRRSSMADDRGRYRFVVPYSTDVRFSPDVWAVHPYQLESSRSSERLTVREEDVLSGAVIHGPTL
jgi:asparagine N-glycosylation enzyme membrane subunit Stt3